MEPVPEDVASAKPAVVSTESEDEPQVEGKAEEQDQTEALQPEKKGNAIPWTKEEEANLKSGVGMHLLSIKAMYGTNRWVRILGSYSFNKHRHAEDLQKHWRELPEGIRKSLVDKFEKGKQKAQDKRKDEAAAKKPQHASKKPQPARSHKKRRLSYKVAEEDISSRRTSTSFKVPQDSVIVDPLISTELVRVDEIACTVCGSMRHNSKMLLCDGCQAGKHLFCFEPPLEVVPEGDYYCADCAPNSALFAQAGASVVVKALATGKRPSSRVITCPECGEQKPHKAKGLCEKCYSRRKQLLAKKQKEDARAAREAKRKLPQEERGPGKRQPKKTKFFDNIEAPPTAAPAPKKKRSIVETIRKSLSKTKKRLGFPPDYIPPEEPAIGKRKERSGDKSHSSKKLRREERRHKSNENETGPDVFCAECQKLGLAKPFKANRFRGMYVHWGAMHPDLEFPMAEMLGKFPGQGPKKELARLERERERERDEDEGRRVARRSLREDKHRRASNAHKEPVEPAARLNLPPWYLAPEDRPVSTLRAVPRRLPRVTYTELSRYFKKVDRIELDFLQAEADCQKGVESWEDRVETLSADLLKVTEKIITWFGGELRVGFRHNPRLDYKLAACALEMFSRLDRLTLSALPAASLPVEWADALGELLAAMEVRVVYGWELLMLHCNLLTQTQRLRVAECLASHQRDDVMETLHCSELWDSQITQLRLQRVLADPQLRGVSSLFRLSTEAAQRDLEARVLAASASHLPLLVDALVAAGQTERAGELLREQYSEPPSPVLRQALVQLAPQQDSLSPALRAWAHSAGVAWLTQAAETVLSNLAHIFSAPACFAAYQLGSNWSSGVILGLLELAAKEQQPFTAEWDAVRHLPKTLAPEDHTQYADRLRRFVSSHEGFSAFLSELAAHDCHNEKFFADLARADETTKDHQWLETVARALNWAADLWKK